jgi:hypothetical protein
MKEHALLLETDEETMSRAWCARVNKALNLKWYCPRFTYELLDIDMN